MENFASLKDMRAHLKILLLSHSASLNLPLFCKDSACQGLGSYASIKIFMQHVVKYHKDQFSDATTSLNHSNSCHFLESTNLNDVDEIYVPNLVNSECYDECITKLLLRLVSNSSIPLSHAGEVVQCLEEYIVVIREKIQKQNDQFVSQAAESSCCNALITSFNSEFDRSLKALRKVNTVYKAKTSLFNHPLYVHPQMSPLSYRREAHLANGNCVVNKLLPDQFCYISIIQTIKTLFQVKEFATCIMNELFNGNDVSGVYQNFKDGSHFKTHGLFSDASKKVLRIQIFYDGMGTTNPLRGHSAPHNLGIFYFTIQNLPDFFNSCFPNIHTFAICYTIDLKKTVLSLS
jgi:hypothetical protein